MGAGRSGRTVRAQPPHPATALDRRQAPPPHRPRGAPRSHSLRSRPLRRAAAAAAHCPPANFSDVDALRGATDYEMLHCFHWTQVHFYCAVILVNSCFIKNFSARWGLAPPFYNDVGSCPVRLVSPTLLPKFSRQLSFRKINSWSRVSFIITPIVFWFLLKIRNFFQQCVLRRWNAQEVSR